MIQISKPLYRHELPEEIRQELDYVCEVIKERCGKTITGKEYELNGNSYYRGTLLGDLISNIYTFSPPVLRSRKKGNRIFVDTNHEMPVEYANYYATNEIITKNFEKEQKRRGFDIPSGGAVLLEIKRDNVKKVLRNYTELHLYGILIEGMEGFIFPHYLTNNCKKYVLDELGLSKDSFIYKVFFKEQLSSQI